MSRSESLIGQELMLQSNALMTEGDFITFATRSRGGLCAFVKLRKNLDRCKRVSCKIAERLIVELEESLYNLRWR
jgi:hypothetical protein